MDSLNLSQPPKNWEEAKRLERKASRRVNALLRELSAKGERPGLLEELKSARLVRDVAAWGVGTFEQ